MKIFNIPSINFNRNNAVQKQNKISPLKQDVFVKQNTPSFKGESFLDSLIDDLFSETEYIIHTLEEKQLRMFLDILSGKKHKTVLDRCKNLKIQEFMGLVNNQMGIELKTIQELFERTGIKSVLTLQLYVKFYNSPELKKIFYGQEIEELEIYSKLSAKDDISKYGELLLYIHNQDSSEKESESHTDLNEITNFLKQLGLSNFKDFDTKFAHLKSDFNDFKNISDKYEAINYLMSSCPNKITLIDEALKSSGSKNVNAERIYFSHPDIIDYLYEKNNCKSLEPLSDFLSCFLSDKIKNPAIKKVSEYFNEFSTPEDKVDFYKFLAQNDVSPEDFNTLMTNTVISDDSVLDYVTNKNLFTKEISSIKDIDNKEALEIYEQFSDVANSLYSKDEADNERLKTLFNIAEMFNLKNSRSLLELYNKVNGTKNKSITIQECRDFIDIMTYCSSDKIIQEARTKKIKAIDILNHEKEHFLALQQDIEDFITENEPISLLGLNTREIYLKYKELLNKNPEDVKSVLENITQLNIENSVDYNQKTTKLESLSEFFDDKKDLFTFVKQAKIKFDGQTEDEEYIENCQKLLRTLKENPSDKEYKGFIQYILNSNFLAKSKNSLTDFLSQYGTDKKTTDLLLLMANKKVPSIEEFLNFIDRYKDNNGDYENLIIHLSETPDDIDFQKYTNALNLAQLKINATNVPLKINNSNIQLLDINYLLNKNNLTPGTITILLNQLSNAEGVNFISKLKNSFTDKDSTHTSFNIANEIAGKDFSGEDKYSNIVSLLKLSKQDLELDEDCAYYIYVRAMADALPQNFVQFINSHDWLAFNDDEQFPNISLHAKLRLADRFALQKCKTIEELYSNSTKNYIKDILKSIYTLNPNSVEADKANKNIITITQYDTDTIKTVFDKKGKMVTIIAKGR